MRCSIPPHCVLSIRVTPNLSDTDPRSTATASVGGERSARWVAGIVNHGSYEDLEGCLASLHLQTLPPVAVCVYDTEQEPTPARALTLRAESRTGLEVVVGPNLGYAGGSNLVIDRLLATHENVDYCLLLNPDVELDPDFARRLIGAIGESPDIAIASGKLLRPDRRTLDSAGIVFPRHRRPRDRGSEQPDRGAFDRRECVQGASGAAMLLRTAAIDDLRIEGELFDESFFLYHEDTDLCWRARNLGWRILYEPTAVAVHKRGWQSTQRFSVPVSTRRHSFKNHYLQLMKNEHGRDFLWNLPWLLTWEVLRIGFVLLRDRSMLPAYADAWRALPDAWRKRRILRARELRSRKAH